MKVWEWNEISCEIVEWTAWHAALDEGWELTRGGPIREYRSDRNHLSLITKAKDEQEAHEKFMTHPEYAEWQ